ncbi:LysR family transcriptional regulator [Enterobacterales bacterium CwR94]|nr:LysR family transcriptional regulator [Enterobacterales bacterium CwR94]
MDKLEAMSLLVKVAEVGSMSEVARQGKLPLTSISRKIADLEAQLGVRLLLRTTRKLTLTDAGIAYVANARRILEEIDAVERMAVGEYLQPKGELVITAPHMFGRRHVLPIVNAFLAAWPDITVRLLLSDRNADLIDDHVDLAVRIGPLADSSMVARAVGEMRSVTCGSPNLFARLGEPQTPQALMHYPCVTIDNPMPFNGWRYPHPVGLVPVKPRLAVTTPEAAADAAAAGTGIARLLHYQVTEALCEGRLKIVLANAEPPPVPVHLLHASRGPMPLKLREFIDFALPRLRETLLVIARSG